MPATDTRSALARKIAAHSGAGHRPADLLPRLEAGLTRAVRRAGAPLEGLAIRVDALDVALQSDLDAAIDALPEHGLVAATEDREGRRGLLALDHALIDALIEVQTTGRVEEAQGPPRPVTRIDEALCRDFIDLFFGAFAHETKDIPGRDWPDRIVYGSQIKDRSQINLLLPARGYHLLKVTVSAAGLKTGAMVVLVPNDVALARRNTQKSDAKPPRPDNWAKDMMAALGSAPLAMDAVLLRSYMPLSKVEALSEGDLIPFDQSDLTGVTLEDDCGHVFARGKLGQMSGRRAVRIGRRQQAPGPSNGADAAAPPGQITAAGAGQSGAAGPAAAPPAAMPEMAMAGNGAGDAPWPEDATPGGSEPLADLPNAAFDPEAPVA